MEVKLVVPKRWLKEFGGNQNGKPITIVGIFKLIYIINANLKKFIRHIPQINVTKNLAPLINYNNSNISIIL